MSDSKILVEYFSNKYRENKGFNYPISWGKHCQIASSLLKDYGLIELYRFIDMFFKDDDQFLVKHGHKIEFFRNSIPKYVNKFDKKIKNTEDFEVLFGS